MCSEKEGELGLDPAQGAFVLVQLLQQEGGIASDSLTPRQDPCDRLKQDATACEGVRHGGHRVTRQLDDG